MEASLVKFLLLILFVIGIAWGGLKTDREWVLVKYNKFSKFIAAFSLLFFLMLTYSAFTAEKGATNFALTVLIVFSIMSAFAVNEAYRAKAWLDEDKIFFQSPYGRKVIIPYSDLTSCKLSRLSYYIIKSNAGKKIRLSIYMAGIDEMIDFVKFKISEHKNA